MAGPLLAAGLLLAACDDGRTRLVVRTDLPRELRDAVEASFEAAAPDVDVRFDVGDPGATLAELVGDPGGEPRSGPPAFDVWWGAPVASLERATRAGALAGWQPLLATPFVIAFDRDRTGLPDAPRDWIDIFHHAWADEVVLPDPTRSDASATFLGAIVAEAIRDEGLSWVGFEWLGRLDRQVVRYVADEREALRTLRLDQARLAVVRRVTAEEARTNDASLSYRIPESGTPVDVLGVAATAGARAPGPARRFVEHLASPDAVRSAAQHTGWEPFAPAALDPPASSSGDEAWTPWALGTDLVVDSLGAWLQRWSRDVRGKGK